jgi:hypothetical protein
MKLRNEWLVNFYENDVFMNAGGFWNNESLVDCSSTQVRQLLMLPNVLPCPNSVILTLSNAVSVENPLVTLCTESQLLHNCLC